MVNQTMPHEKYMKLALSLARMGLGRTWPNPAVGCVIIKDDEVIAQARTANGGRPHAEALALQHAGNNSQGATAYVTLEPCAHHGETPPCAESLVKAGIAEVIIGCIDLDKRTTGKGIKILKDAGIKVTAGLLENECREVNKGFFKVIEKGLPHVMLKAAISADGKYLPGNGKPKWVTGETAQEEVQSLRSIYDVIITGTGTVLADNPQLNVRLPGLEDNSPIKVIIGNRPIPGSANILRGKEVWLYNDGLGKVFHNLAERGITRVMVETGPKLSNAILGSGLVDEVIIFQSPKNLGDAGEIFFTKDALTNFKKTKETKIGDDLMQVWN